MKSKCTRSKTSVVKETGSAWKIKSQSEGRDKFADWSNLYRAEDYVVDYLQVEHYDKFECNNKKNEAIFHVSF